MGLLGSNKCWLCGFVFPPHIDTCPECGYHRRTKHRVDGKKGMKNDPRYRSQIKENVIKEYRKAKGLE